MKKVEERCKGFGDFAIVKFFYVTDLENGCDDF